MSTTLQIDHAFDSQKMRHYLNGETSVLHCHHYACLYSQLALDAGETELLSTVAEDTFGEMLSRYFQDNFINTLADRLDIACRYYAALGLGQMSVNRFGSDSGEVVLQNSHVDQGWIKKWGRYDAPVNYITAGYIAGMFSAVLDCRLRTFTAKEVQSIVQGADQSIFKVFKK